MFRRSVADIRQKEYAVFLEPVLRPFQRNSGIVEAADALRALDAIPSAEPPVLGLAPPTTNAVVEAQPTPYEGYVGEDVVDPQLVEEIFARATPHITLPEEQADVGGYEDPSEQPVIAEGSSTPEVEQGPSDNPPRAAAPSATPNSPLIRTMVEAIPNGKDGNGEGALGDFLSDDLQDIFTAADYTNPRTKALLKSRERVDVHELAAELLKFAQSVGAVPKDR